MIAWTHELRAGRAVVVVLAMLALLIVTLAWTFRDAPEPPAIAPSTSAVEREAAEAVVVADADVLTAASRAAIGGSPGAATTSAIDELVGERVEVLVLDAETGAPVAGAVVRWAGVDAFPEPSLFDDELAPFPADAPSTRSDARGIAIADSRLVPGRVEASSAGRFGAGYVDARTPRPVRVALARDVELVIEVVDAERRPVAGVPVALRDEEDPRTSGHLRREITGADGRARFEHCQGLVDPRRTPALFAALDIPLRHAVQETIDASDFPSSPVRLVLPPCGSVVVGLHDAEGTPSSVLQASLAIAEEARAPEEWSPSGRMFRPASVVVGEARFPFVGTGLHLEARAFRTSSHAEADALGPRTAGELVRIDLDLGARERELRARLVDATGEPIRDRRVYVEIRGPSSNRSSQRSSDAEGRIRLPLDAQPPKSISFMPIGPGIGADAEIEVGVPTADARGDVDLGDVVLAPPLVVGAGRVVDDLGRPVEGALIVVHVSALDVDDGAWRSSARVRTRMGADGKFELLARGELARLRVSATRAGHADAPAVELEPGRTGLVLVLPRACEIAGRVIVDDGVDPTRIRVRALVAGEARPTAALGSDRETPIAHDGSFRLPALPPGRFDVELHVRSTGAVLRRIEGVDAPPGGKSTDVRLDAIDLRGAVANPEPR